MSNEIQLNFELIVNNGFFDRSAKATTYDMTGKRMSAGVADLVVHTSIIYVDASLTTWGMAWFQNLSDIYTIEVGKVESIDYGTTFFPLLSIRPGGVASGELKLDASHLAARVEADEYGLGMAQLQWKVFER